MVRNVDESTRISSSLSSSFGSGEDLALKIESGVDSVIVEESVYGRVVSKSSNVRINIYGGVHADRSVALQIQSANYVKVSESVYGTIDIRDPNATVKILESVFEEGGQGRAIMIRKADSVKIQESVYGDVVIRGNADVKITGSVHGSIIVQNPGAKVNASKVFDDIEAPFSDQVDCREVFGRKKIENQNNKAHSNSNTDSAPIKRKNESNKETIEAYTQDYSNIESEKLAIWIMANVADIETRIEDVWLTDGAYPNFDLVKTLREIDTWNKANMLNQRNATVNFTDEHLSKIKDIQRDSEPNNQQRTVQKIAQHLSDEEYENPLQAEIAFEKENDTSSEVEEEYNEKGFSALDEI